MANAHDALITAATNALWKLEDRDIYMNLWRALTDCGVDLSAIVRRQNDEAKEALREGGWDVW